MALPGMQKDMPEPIDGLAPLTLDDTQLQELNNRFIEGQQEALFGAPDALYRLSGPEAMAAAPRTLAKLAELKATLGAFVPDGEADGELGRQLAWQLDRHLAGTTAEVRRHVARETQA